MAYTKYSLTPSSNTAAPPDGAPEGMLPSAVNDTMRDMMAQIRDCGDGIRDGTYTMTAPKITGGTITGAAFTGNTFTSPVISGGTINNATIGATTATTGKFTTLEATGVATFSAGAVGTPAITTTGDTNTGIFFPAADTIAFTEGGVESMRIDSSGNVGIGTSSPNADSAAFAPVLSVKGGSFDGVLELIGSRADGSATGVGQLRFVQNANTTGKTISYIIGETEGATANNRGGTLQFWTKANAGSLAERMRIDSSGFLLVNTTTARNSGRISVDFDGTTAGGAGINDTASANGSAFIGFVTGGTFRGNITNNNNTAVAYNTTSDYRLKENIAPMTGALATISQLKPCTYVWKETGSAGQGFIAHELAEVCPDAVTGEKDAVGKDGKPKYQGVDTSFLVATLTAAIQEQQTLIENLTTRLNALEGN